MGMCLTAQSVVVKRDEFVSPAIHPNGRAEIERDAFAGCNDQHKASTRPAGTSSEGH